MPQDTKIAVVVRQDLETWQKLNVACFLAGGLVGRDPTLAGEPYRDADGIHYAPLIRAPVLVFAADSEGLAAARWRALDRGITPAIYTQALFGTYNDVDNRAAVAAVATDALDLVGLALAAERRLVDKILKGLSLHR
jgi:hypothetical protein